MDKIEEIINAFKSKCSAAKSEDDVKAATNVFIDSASKIFNVDVKTENEATFIHGGRADSVFNDIIFEYKKLKLFSTKNGIRDAIYGRDAKDHGLYHYIVNSAIEESHDDEQIFKEVIFNKIGIGFDGEKFVITRFIPSRKKTKLDTQKTKNWPSNFSTSFYINFEITQDVNFDEGVRRIILYLRSTNRRPLTANELCKLFSHKSQIAQSTISYLYTLLRSNMNENTRIKTLYKEWERIFGTIYDEDESDQSDFVKIVKGVKKIYPIKDEFNVKEYLFTIQTYYSIIIKLLIQNLFDSLTNPGSKMAPIKDASDLLSLFVGNRNEFNNYISNFFEINFFEWFLLSEKFDINYVNNIIRELDQIETTVSVIKPEIVQDVLKKTYESITPKELRHLMGEYYTVNWLADFTIKKSGYDGGVCTSVMDPTCGSGTFVLHLIKLYKARYSGSMDYNELIEHIIENFVGFDINPIAVIQAKGNYILTLGDITKLKNRIAIPIYMCDSVLVPTVYAKQKDGAKTIRIKTSVAEFELPLFKNRIESDVYLRILSECILKEYDVYEDFENRLWEEAKIKVADDMRSTSRTLFIQLMKLHHAGKDGFWPIILKNSFAPLFCKQNFDYVIGNPPWIAWKAMSQTYRDLSLDIWLSYGIFDKDAYGKITSHDDFAMAVTYVIIDHYLKPHGEAALILPQTFVKSLKGGEGFRKFCITRNHQEIPFKITQVYDMLDINPFKGVASNKTSVYIFKKSEEMKYPMDEYYEGKVLPGKTISADDTEERIEEEIIFEKKCAMPINQNPRSPWLTLPSSLISSINKYLGRSAYQGRKGIEPCGAKGVYLVDILQSDKDRSLLKIKNMIERSRLDAAKALGVHTGWVNAELIYPMVGGRNIDKWGLNSCVYMLVPHNNGKNAYRGIPESEMRTKYFRTFDWLYYFHDLLLNTRIRSGKFFDPKQFPWYRLDNVGPYTFSKYKVLWKEQSKKMSCCVVSSLSNEYMSNRTVVTDSKVLFVPLEDELEAHYLCAVLNSKVIEEIVQGYTINTNRGIDIVKNIRIPKYDANNKLHRELAYASIEAHQAYLERQEEVILKSESKINSIVSLIF